MRGGDQTFTNVKSKNSVPRLLRRGILEERGESKFVRQANGWTGLDTTLLDTTFPRVILQGLRFACLMLYRCGREKVRALAKIFEKGVGGGLFVGGGNGMAEERRRRVADKRRDLSNQAQRIRNSRGWKRKAHGAI